jgi:hypothetical protein
LILWRQKIKLWTSHKIILIRNNRTWNQIHLSRVDFIHKNKFECYFLGWCTVNLHLGIRTHAHLWCVNQRLTTRQIWISLTHVTLWHHSHRPCWLIRQVKHWVIAIILNQLTLPHLQYRLLSLKIFYRLSELFFFLFEQLLGSFCLSLNCINFIHDHALFFFLLENLSKVILFFCVSFHKFIFEKLDCFLKSNIFWFLNFKLIFFILDLGAQALIILPWNKVRNDLMF